jgi:hypothetical protein
MIPTKIHSDISEANVKPLNPLESLSENPKIEEIKSAIVYIAVKYGLDESQLYQTILCESGFKYDAKNPTSAASGVAQFMPSTWKIWNEERGTDLNYYSPRDQLDMMGWAWHNGYQKHWECFKMYFLN